MVGVFSLSDKIAFFEDVFGKGRISSNGINFDVRCPICAPSDPTKKKLSIRTDDDRLHCWVCGFRARSLAPLLRKYGTQSQQAKYREMFGGPDSSSGLVTGEVEEQYRLELPGDFCLLPLASVTDPDVKAAWRYIIGRGLSERDAWYWKMGVSNDPKWRRRIIMPSFDAAGKLNYFVARAIDKDRKPKYDNPPVDHREVIFNEINIDWTKPLVLVEGPFDMTKCPDNTTALLGSDLSEQHQLFNKVLISEVPVYLAMDGDMWDTKMPRVYKKLVEYNVDVKVVDVRPWGDPGSMSKAEFLSAMEDSKRLTWEDDFSRRLRKASQLRPNL